MDKIEFSEIDFASDVKDFVTMSSDVSCSQETKEKIFNFEDSKLLNVKKTISSPITIIDVNEVNEDFIKDNL